jgi:CheY-like chemotaxis protein
VETDLEREGQLRKTVWQEFFANMPSKVLIVDDDPLMHLLYKNQLERAGYEMVTAKDGSEVVDVATREQPMVIFMDIIMADMDGLAALRALKKTESTKVIPVVITTASVSSHQATKKECESSGAAGFLTKPFSPAQLLAEVRRVVPDSTPGNKPG